MIGAVYEWETLLRLALPALDHVFPAHGIDAAPKWTLGGGTAIMLQIGHRISHDIDIFVPGTRLKAFSPAANPAAALISRRFPVRAAPNRPWFSWQRHAGRMIALETPEEVIVKKVRYRSERFTARDAFDLAAVPRSGRASNECCRQRSRTPYPG